MSLLTKGGTLDQPKDIESYYDPSGRSPIGYNQTYLVPLYDLLNKAYTDVVTQPIAKGMNSLHYTS